MKHIEKRFLEEYSKIEFETKFSKENIVTFEKVGNDLQKKLAKNKHAEGFLIMESGHYIKSFNHKINGKDYLFPIPDPTLIYFAGAQDKLRLLKENKKQLLTNLDLNNKTGEEIYTSYYQFYINSCGCIIFLFTTLECFMNYLIPDDKLFEKKLANKTEIYNKDQIERNIAFWEKINTVIPFFTEQDFIKSHPTFKINLENLKNMRDDIIHTKSKENSSTVGNSILKKTLNFNYELAIESVAKYINFYEPDKIKECPCDANF